MNDMYTVLCMYMYMYMDHGMYSSSQENVSILFPLHTIKRAPKEKPNGDKTEVLKWEMEKRNQCIRVQPHHRDLKWQTRALYLAKLPVRILKPLW